MIQHPVYKERYQYNLISNIFLYLSLKLSVRLPSPQVLAASDYSVLSTFLLAFLKSPVLGILASIYLRRAEFSVEKDTKKFLRSTLKSTQ